MRGQKKMCHILIDSLQHTPWHFIQFIPKKKVWTDTERALKKTIFKKVFVNISCRVNEVSVVVITMQIAVKRLNISLEIR